jgi:O-methyltransferase
MPFSKATPERIAKMAECCMAVDLAGVPGAIVETGVFLGANIIAARLAAPARVCWLYDTFEGMTEPTHWDVTRGGKSAKRKYGDKAGEPWMRASLDDCRRALAAAKVYDPALCKFVVGPVERTLNRPENLPKEIAVLRLDTDWYGSTKVSLEQLWPRLRPGGYLIVDDYGHWLGCKRAVDGYFLGREDAFDTWTQIDYTCVVIRKR